MGFPEEQQPTTQADLQPCPFCGGDASYFYTQYSGMEPATVHAGCKPCGVSFSGGGEQGWSKGAGWFDRKQEAHDKAGEQWNTRAELTQPTEPATLGGGGQTL